MLTAVIGLGSNLGDRRRTLSEAARRIAELGTLRARSRLYETDPVGPPQGVYLNAALRLETPLDPESLLDSLLGIERAFGRVRLERWGPRTLDLDVLWLEGRTFDSPRLVVPHPELRSRPFALRPLLDVAPDAADPRDGARYAAVLAELDAGSVRELAGTDRTWG